MPNLHHLFQVLSEDSGSLLFPGPVLSSRPQCCVHLRGLGLGPETHCLTPVCLGPRLLEEVLETLSELWHPDGSWERGRVRGQVGQTRH